MGGRGSSSATSVANIREVRARLRRGEMPQVLPGTRYEAQFKEALNLIADNYVPSQELESYMRGSFANGIPHVSVTDNGDYAYIRVGNKSGSQRFPEFDLTQRQRQALIDWRIYGIYRNRPELN